MRSWLRTLLPAAATVTLVSSTAAAACTSGGLAGQWDSYAIGDAGGEPFWERCEFRFDAAGKLLSDSVCHTDTGDRSTLSGRFILNTHCRATGSLTQQFPGEPPNACTIAQGTLSKDQEVFTGVGTCKSSKSTFSFTMIRR
jgi:hypothetical protein